MNQMMKLTDLLSKDLLQQMQELFAAHCGAAILMTDSSGTAVTKGSNFCRFCSLTRSSKEGSRRCEESDKQGGIVAIQTGKVTMYHCHTGFLDFAAPILLEGECIGSVVGGQIRTEEVKEDEIREIALRYGLDPEEYVAEAYKANQADLKQLEATIQFLSDVSGIISKIAYERYQALQQNKQVIQEANSQSQLLIQLNNQLQQKVNALSGQIGNGTLFTGEQFSEEHVQELLDQTSRLGGMVEDTYEYIHMTDGSPEFTETPYEVHYTISSEIRKRKAGHPELDERLSFAVEPGVPSYLLGDPTRIGQIESRLIDFGLRRSSSDRICVGVRCYPQSYATMLELTFTYDGSCLSKEELSRVKHAMQDSGNSLIERQEYDLIGLSVASWLTRWMSGRITVENTGDHSYQFQLAIPQLGTKGSDY